MGKQAKASVQSGGGTQGKPAPVSKPATTAALIVEAYRALSLTSGQIGKIGEGLVYRIATLQSDGELVFYKPEDDNEGTDWIAKRRYRGADIKVQVKAREPQRPNGAVEVSIDAASLPPDDPKLVTILQFDAARPEAALICWVIPSGDFRRLSSFSAGQYQALLSPAPNARDRWVKYRHELQEIADVFTAHLDDIEKREARRLRPSRRAKP